MPGEDETTLDNGRGDWYQNGRKERKRSLLQWRARLSIMAAAKILSSVTKVGGGNRSISNPA